MILEYVARAEKEYNATFIRGRPGRIEVNPSNDNPITWYEDTATGEIKGFEMELVVLAQAILPQITEELAEILGIDLDENGFVKIPDKLLQPMDTTRPGILACGCVHSPRDIPDSVVQASGVAGRASEVLTAVLRAKGRILCAANPMDRERAGAGGTVEWCQFGAGQEACRKGVVGIGVAMRQARGYVENIAALRSQRQGSTFSLRRLKLNRSRPRVAKVRSTREQERNASPKTGSAPTVVGHLELRSILGSAFRGRVLAMRLGSTTLTHASYAVLKVNMTTLSSHAFTISPETILA